MCVCVCVCTCVNEGDEEREKGITAVTVREVVHERMSGRKVLLSTVGIWKQKTCTSERGTATFVLPDLIFMKFADHSEHRSLFAVHVPVVHARPTLGDGGRGLCRVHVHPGPGPGPLRPVVAVSFLRPHGVAGNE